MATTSIYVRVDTNLKKSAEELFSDLGLNMSTAINMSLKTAVNYEGIPFEVKRTKLNNVSLSALAEYKEMKEHPENYKEYNSFEEILNDITNENHV